jgi:hypothetical protein
VKTEDGKEAGRGRTKAESREEEKTRAKALAYAETKSLGLTKKADRRRAGENGPPRTIFVRAIHKGVKGEEPEETLERERYLNRDDSVLDTMKIEEISEWAKAMGDWRHLVAKRNPTAFIRYSSARRTAMAKSKREAKRKAENKESAGGDDPAAADSPVEPGPAPWKTATEEEKRQFEEEESEGQLRYEREKRECEAPTPARNGFVLFSNFYRAKWKAEHPENKDKQMPSLGEIGNAWKAVKASKADLAHWQERRRLDAIRYVREAKAYHLKIERVVREQAEEKRRWDDQQEALASQKRVARRRARAAAAAATSDAAPADTSATP